MAANAARVAQKHLAPDPVTRTSAVRIRDAQSAWDALEKARKILRDSMKPQKNFGSSIREAEELIDAVKKAGPFGGEEPDPGIMMRMDDEVASFYKHYDQAQQALGRLEAHLNWAIGSGY